MRWRCHICKELRPDTMIDVVRHDTSELYNLPPGTMIQNTRYCLDNPECLKAAVKMDTNKNDS